MKFANATLGTRAERPITFQIRGTDHAFAIRPLTAAEDAMALEHATAYAQDHKAQSATPGNPLFDLGYMLHTLALACVDVDSPIVARENFWANAAEIEGALGPEDIAFLHARYEAWQAECSPTRSSMSGAELVGHLIRISEDGADDLPFSQLRPGLAWILLRTTARLLLSSPELRSQLTSLFGTTPSDSPKKPPKPANNAKPSSPPGSNSSANTGSTT